MELPHAFYIIFFFLLGSCVGSFLNVVVWRLPNVEPIGGEGIFRGFWRGMRALASPPSHCPKCNQLLKWYDNLPVVGWIKLRGRCRFCKAPISVRYPIIEAICGLLFVLYYVCFFIEGMGPCHRQMTSFGFEQYLPSALSISEHWPIYLLDMVLISALLGASLVDAELFIIPLGIPWFVVPLALAEHAIWDRVDWPGALNLSAKPAALAAGAGVGLVISFILWWLGIIPTSFSEGGPLLEVDKARLTALDETPRDYTSSEIRREMRKEMLFLLPPLALGLAWLFVTWRIPSISRIWASAAGIGWVGGLLGSVLGLLVGGFLVWFFRIGGSYVFGREAMGLGDVHLMAAIGAVLGAGPATIAFFVAPFFGIGLALYFWFLRRSRELPYGPYLSLATAFVMLFYCPIADYLWPNLNGIIEIVAQSLYGR